MVSHNVWNEVAANIAQAIGANVIVESQQRIGGGSINDAYRLVTSAGSFFVKVNTAKDFPGMFDREAEGLLLLQTSNTLRIPRIITRGMYDAYMFLVLEWVDKSLPKAGFGERLGTQLAAMHRCTASHYGLATDNYMGALKQYNRPSENWIDFFISQRLKPQVTLADLGGLLPAKTKKQFQKLYKMLPDLLPTEQPALLHGDLWSGNVMADATGNPCIFDPAVYYGHREVDLAMTRLFGGFNTDFYEAYHEVNPLQPGFEQRVDIYNLYPLVVHLNLFGSGYLSDIQQIVQRY